MGIDGDELPGDACPVAADGPFRLTVDGETFMVTIRPDEDNVYDYEWETGPNPYGFSSSVRVAGDPNAVIPPQSVDNHRSAIRNFLDLINPETGYIGD
ncbi:hypothetical protein OG921_12765 [Aldersonia sp. NBC_00410]|uniref:hypothetical protein n=1 Tax=Aldersonia sp. NBC_00410 TaxID=2975954 RepID=UPI0022591FE0|nr:hypothetical protein [Aldersonia sp. NBC_00410]MCX5044041.1 hypothetical protein [Aldersonia sp. NBC_00410]